MDEENEDYGEKFPELFLNGEHLSKLMDVVTRKAKELAKGKTQLPTMLLVSVHLPDEAKELMKQEMNLPEELGDDPTMIPFHLYYPEMDEKDKYEWMFGLGEQFTDIPTAIFLISEAWMGSQDPDDAKKPIVLPVRDDPNKTEVLIVSCLTLEKKSLTNILAIDRTPEREIILGNIVKTDNSSSGLLENFWLGYAKGLFQRIKDRPKDESEESDESE